MLRDRATEGRAWKWFAGVGAALGLSAGAVLAVRRRGGPGRAEARGIERLEGRLAEALAADDLAVRRPIEAGALAYGIIELTGSVRDEAEAAHVLAVAQAVPGVRTVLNRLDIESEEARLAENRRRAAVRGPGERETHWYGLRVGTGRRRQGEETDPDRPDGRVPIVSRELGANRAIEQTSEELDKLAPGVEGHTTVPAAPTDRGTVDDAPHGRLGNVPREPLQDLHPEAGILENVKKGTRVTLEESAPEKEPIDRDREDRS